MDLRPDPIAAALHPRIVSTGYEAPDTFYFHISLEIESRDSIREAEEQEQETLLAVFEGRHFSPALEQGNMIAAGLDDSGTARVLRTDERGRVLTALDPAERALIEKIVRLARGEGAGVRARGAETLDRIAELADVLLGRSR